MDREFPVTAWAAKLSRIRWKNKLPLSPQNCRRSLSGAAKGLRISLHEREEKDPKLIATHIYLHPGRITLERNLVSEIKTYNTVTFDVFFSYLQVSA